MLFSARSMSQHSTVTDSCSTPRQHAETMIRDLEASHAKSIAGTSTADDDSVHHHRVVGGLKAALKNEHVHEEKKAEIRTRLDEMGEQYEQ